MTQETEKLANDNSSMNLATHTHSDTLNTADTHRHTSHYQDILGVKI